GWGGQRRADQRGLRRLLRRRGRAPRHAELLRPGHLGGQHRQRLRGGRPGEPDQQAREQDPLVPGQLTSPDRLSPRLPAERLNSNYHVLGRPQPSTYTYVRLGLRPPLGLVWLAISPGTSREHGQCRQYSLETR